MQFIKTFENEPREGIRARNYTFPVRRGFFKKFDSVFKVKMGEVWQPCSNFYEQLREEMLIQQVSFDKMCFNDYYKSGCLLNHRCTIRYACLHLYKRIVLFCF